MAAEPEYTPRVPEIILGDEPAISLTLGPDCIIGPNDKLLVRFPAGSDFDNAKACGRLLRRTFGEGRSLVLVGDIEIAVVQGDE